MAPAPPAVLLGAFLAALVLTPLTAGLLERLGAVDRPDARRLHAVPTPRGGGLGILLPWLLLLAAGVGPGHWPVLVAAVAALGAVGLWDDLAAPPPLPRFLLQAVIVLSALLALPVPPLALGPVAVTSATLWLLLAVPAVLWVVNLYNFMDGSNGLAAGQGVFAGATLGLVALDGGHVVLATACGALAAACLGFLPWNFPRARVFLGDVGSIGLGGAVALLAVLGAVEGAWSLYTPALVMSVFLVDATATLLARMARGERWYTPHRSHLYQRLIGAGRSHLQVAGAYFGVNLLIVLPVAWCTRDSWAVQPLACIALWMVLLLAWGILRRT